MRFSLLLVSLLLSTAALPARKPAADLRAADPHGELHHQTFTTKVVLGLPENADDYNVYTPPGYDANGLTRYPVLYLLHGWSQNASSWDTAGHARQTLDELIASGRAKPMIVVMPLGYGDMHFLHDGFDVWRDPAAIDHNVGLFQQSLLTEVIPQVEAAYKVASGRENRAIAGLSMGGLESLEVGLNNTGEFAWIGGFSSAVHLLQPASLNHLDPKTANLKLLWIACGSSDQLLTANHALESALTASGLQVTAIETPGAHVWPVWREDLLKFVPLLFQGR